MQRNEVSMKNFLRTIGLLSVLFTALISTGANAADETPEEMNLRYATNRLLLFREQTDKLISALLPDQSKAKLCFQIGHVEAYESLFMRGEKEITEWFWEIPRVGIIATSLKKNICHGGPEAISKEAAIAELRRLSDGMNITIGKIADRREELRKQREPVDISAPGEEIISSK
jgi:hypothetical protein